MITEKSSVNLLSISLFVLFLFFYHATFMHYLLNCIAFTLPRPQKKEWSHIPKNFANSRINFGFIIGIMTWTGIRGLCNSDKSKEAVSYL